MLRADTHYELTRVDFDLQTRYALDFHGLGWYHDECMCALKNLIIAITIADSVVITAVYRQ